MSEERRIYVASLSDYNAGRLHGRWIDAIQDIDNVWAEIHAMLAASPEFREFPQGGPAEEWAIHDFEGFGPLRLNEYDSIDKVVAIAQRAEDTNGEAFLAWLSYEEKDQDEWEDFDEVFCGEWDCVRDYVAYEVEELGLPGLPSHIDVPSGPYGQTEKACLAESIWSYLDWDILKRDLYDHSSKFSVDSGNGTVYIFDPERV